MTIDEKMGQTVGQLRSESWPVDKSDSIPEDGSDCWPGGIFLRQQAKRWIRQLARRYIFETAS
jgi:hypothetical protein